MSGPGHLLTGAELQRALRNRDRVFQPGSWSEDQVRSGGYDLRLAGNLLVAPSGDDSEYRSVGPDEHELLEITLRPGDAALVSTAEVFSLDLDILGQVTPKFRWAARGLLTLSGTAIHSGYGRARQGDDWLPNGERLYLILANNGPADITLRRHDTIAYLQLIEVDPGGAPPEERNLGFDYLRSSLFDPNHGSLKSGLSYFRTLKELEKALADAVDTQQANLADVRQKVDETSAIVDRVQSATNTVVVFGVYLIAVTLLGFVAAKLTDSIASLPHDLELGRAIVVYSVLGAYALTAVAAVWLVGRAINRRR